MASLPSTQLGVLTTPSSSKVQSFPVPLPDADEVLIHNHFVASNPKDWKVPNRFEDYAFIEGNDVAGHIAAVGENVTEYKVGDRVGAFTKMGTKENKYGAYAQYTVAPSAITFPLGSNTTFEAAATLPLAVMTAAIGLFKRLALPEPPSSGFAPQGETVVIINGASSSVGAYAVQLAKRAGLYVVGVAGKSAGYAKSLGADIVVNYVEEKDLESALVRAVGNRSSAHAFDAVSANGSSLLLARVLAKTSAMGKGKVTFVLAVTDEEQTQLPAGIEVERTGVSTAYGDDIDFAAKYYRLIARWVDEGSFKPNIQRILPGGLSAVEEGLRALKAGEVHAEKLVYCIADTPGVQK